MAISNPGLIAGIDTNGTNQGTPDNTLISDGYLFQSIPKSSDMNRYFKELYRGMHFVKETGMWQWDNTVSYAEHARQMRNGKIYVSLQDANQGNDPLSTLGTFWKFEDFTPIGTIILFENTSAPSGYLIMDNSEISETTYADLFAIVGTKYNTFDGASAPSAGNFRLPPQASASGRGLYSRGVGSINGPVGTFEQDDFKSHTHTQTVPQAQAATAFGSDVRYDAVGNVVATGAVGGIETRPITVTKLYCIKY